jgi:hypothetical protein
LGHALPVVVVAAAGLAGIGQVQFAYAVEIHGRHGRFIADPQSDLALGAAALFRAVREVGCSRLKRGTRRISGTAIP